MQPRLFTLQDRVARPRTQPDTKEEQRAAMELLERERFLQALSAALSRVVAGSGHTAVISGEAGIGKTALVEHFTSQHGQDARVLWGGCEALFYSAPARPAARHCAAGGGGSPCSS